MKTSLFKNHYFWLFLVLSAVYIIGLFVPLMDEDAAHHADIALHMYLTGDYVSLIDRGMDYLDKPHLHFWLAAFSYHLLGVNTIAYKLPSFIMTILGTYATYGLGRLLYTKETGTVAALMVASAQAYILANNDVRMDALLTASIIFATWQLAEYATTGRWYHFILAPLGLAMGFAVKGMIGLVMPCAALFFWLLYQRNWKVMFSWRWLPVLALWLVFISPVLYCYYLQYDLHPEKSVRGMTRISGVKFILWSQNTERMEGSNWGKKKNNYFFFFHTMLWAFLPWCLITYHALFKRIGFFAKSRFRYISGNEFLTIGIIILIGLLISCSHYKLPHYLNILFPFFSILTAGWLTVLNRQKNTRLLRSYVYTQYFVAVICILIVAVVNLWAFPVSSPLLMLTALLTFLVLLFLPGAKRYDDLSRIMIVSVLVMVFCNMLLNGNFYPKLLTYQAGIGLSDIAKRRHVSKEDLCFFEEHSFSFDFYNGSLSPLLTIDKIAEKRKSGETVWVYTNEDGKKKLEDSGMGFREIFSHTDYGITRLKPAFMDPASRMSVCNTHYLIHLAGDGERNE